MTGRVVDAASGQPTAGVSVFLAGTSHRTTTDGQGGFTLFGVAAGVYEVTAHQPGYAPTTVVSRPTTSDGAAATGDIVLRLSTKGASGSGEPSTGSGSKSESRAPDSLSPAARETINALRGRVEQLEARVALISRQVGLLRDEQRGTTLLSMNEDKLEDFEEFFLGKDREQCELLNPGVLSFKSTDEARDIVLQATTDQPLEVLNRRLGYRLRVVLNDFSVAEGGRQTAVLGDALVSFEPLTPGSEDIAEQWQKERRAAYEGSLVHLLRALGAKRAADEDFSIDRPSEAQRRTSASLAGRTYTETQWIPLRDLPERVAVGEAPFVRAIRLEETYRVRHDGGAAWYLSLNKDIERFTVLGQPLAPGTVQTEGYWPVQPICRQVPANYVPNDS